MICCPYKKTTIAPAILAFAGIVLALWATVGCQFVTIHYADKRLGAGYLTYEHMWTDVNGRLVESGYCKIWDNTKLFDAIWKVGLGAGLAATILGTLSWLVLVLIMSFRAVPGRVFVLLRIGFLLASMLSLTMLSGVTSSTVCMAEHLGGCSLGSGAYCSMAAFFNFLMASLLVSRITARGNKHAKKRTYAEPTEMFDTDSESLTDISSEIRVRPLDNI